LPDMKKNLEPVRLRWNLFRLFASGMLEDSFWEDLEEILLSGDTGVSQTLAIVEDLRSRLSSRGGINGEKALALLGDILCERLAAIEGTGEPVRFGGFATAVLLLGVNGSGKTTTAAKLAFSLKEQGRKVILAAADTYRAAASEQLRIWGERSGTRVISHAPGGDPGAVVFDAMKAAAAGSVDCVIIDTAGRLHTSSNLMEELAKIKRMIEQYSHGSIIESLLVMDAVTGQNGFRQAEAFSRAVPLTGVIMTKYDHTAKGGVILSVGSELNLPVRYIGLGEALGDLRLFNPREFVDGLLANDKGGEDRWTQRSSG